MVQKELKLITYALKDGNIIHISEVERGINCDCICPACGDKLIAKKGQRKVHHFAHQTTENCEYGYETSLHLAAKDILSKAKKMIIPPVYIRFDEPNQEWRLMSWKEAMCVSEAKEITFDRVELEQHFDDIVPDIVVYAGKKSFFIEIFVTHCIDEEKLKKIRAADISTIEIDLSKIDPSITKSELELLLTENNETKYWKYNSLANKYLNKFYSVADKRNIAGRGFSNLIVCCPISTRIRHGKSYANLLDDCERCKYYVAHGCAETGKAEFILCSGRQRVSTIEDLRRICAHP